MNKKDLMEWLKAVPDDTQLFVRNEDEMGDLTLVILGDLEKGDPEVPLQVCFMTTRQFYGDNILDSCTTQEEVDAKWAKHEARTPQRPYPGDLDEVCAHYRAVMGYCGSCALSREDEDDEPFSCQTGPQAQERCQWAVPKSDEN